MAEASASPRPLRVCVAIPHFHQPTQEEGYGATRRDGRLQRALSLSRCLAGVLALARGAEDLMLQIAERALQPLPLGTYPTRQLHGLELSCHLFVTGEAWLRPVAASFGSRLRVHALALDDPLQLPMAAREFLLSADADAADLVLYLEDDLVIQDRLFVDKLVWFLQRTQHRFALMPHRYECTGDPRHPRLFVDGPIDPIALPAHQQPAVAVASGQFWDGQTIAFDLASNPHSGCFCLSREQRRVLQQKGMASSWIIGPLETVATYTVLEHFPVLKPSWPCRDFLLLEHGHPSFLHCHQQWPRLALPDPGAGATSTLQGA